MSKTTSNLEASGDANRVVLVTGAGNGLGAAFAAACAAHGLCVVVNNRSHEGQPSSAERVVETIRAAGGRAVPDLHDVTTPEAAQGMVRTALDAYGRLDAIIFNAGITGPAIRFVKGDPAAFRDVMEVNFFANVALAHAAREPLIASPSGRMLFVTSSAGLHGLHGRAPYAAAKGALNGFALSLASELKRDGVTVNLLAPFAATRMTGTPEDTDVANMMTPERVAPAAVWLTSTSCERTGEIWVAGGGYLRRARTLESPGGAWTGEEVPSADWFTANADRCGDMVDAVGFSEAGTAFADLSARLARRMKASGENGE